MANASGSKVFIVVETGSGTPKEKAFVSGKEVAPFSVGSAGMWPVSGPGIADVHGFFYFDGESLFVQSAGTRFIVTVDGRRVGTDWEPIRPPCRVQMGGVTLSYRPEVEDEGETIASAHPPVPRGPSNRPASPPVASPSARPFRPGEFASVADDGATRVQDITTGSKSIGRHPVAGSRPAPPVPQESERPLAEVPVQRPAPPGGAQTGDESPLAKARAAFNAMSIPMKIAAAGVPIMLLGIALLPTETPAPKGASGADAGALREGSAAPPLDAGPRSQPPAAPLVAPPEPPADGAVVEFNADGDAGPARLPAGKKTDERQAIDHAVAGRFLEAAAIYDQLARENPTKPAYAEAAKIMRARAGVKR